MKKKSTKNNAIKYKKFPIGFFLLLFSVEAVLTTASLAVYFTQSGNRITSEIEEYTKEYSITMAEAVSDTAQLSCGLKNYTALSDLLSNRIQQNIIDEAFFVLNNGTIVVHSQKETVENLQGNIGNDEFTYNIDLILSRSRQNNREVLFCDYNFMNKTIPFNAKELEFLKKYIYKSIDSTGWLTSKAVFVKNKSIGTVNFLISKERIYDTLTDLADSTKKYWFFGIAGSFILSLLISLFIVLRYRSIQKKTLRQSVKIDENDAVTDSIISEIEDAPFEDFDYEYSKEEIPSCGILSEENDEDKIIIDISEPEEIAPLNLDQSELHLIEDIPPSEKAKIKDAVPIRKTLKK